MLKTVWGVWIVLGLGCWAAAAPQVVAACSGARPCPRSLTVPPNGGRLPANMQVFLWRPPCSSESRPVLEAVTAAGKRVVEMHVEPAPESIESYLKQVRWDEALEPGTELLFSFDEPIALQRTRDKDAGPPAMQRRVVEIRVGEQAELLEQLGLVVPTRAFGAFLLASGEGDCAHFVQAAYVDLTLIEPLADAPWANAFVYETRVDDARWAPYRTHNLEGESDSWIGGSSLGHHRNRVYLPCALPAHSPSDLELIKDVLTPGEHTARIVGILPDGTEVSSPPYTFSLACPSELPDAGVTEFLSPEWREQQRALMKSDASVARPAASSGGCTVGSPVGGTPLLWLGVVALLAVLRGRTIV